MHTLAKALLCVCACVCVRVCTWCACVCRTWHMSCFFLIRLQNKQTVVKQFNRRFLIIVERYSVAVYMKCTQFADVNVRQRRRVSNNSVIMWLYLITLNDSSLCISVHRRRQLYFLAQRNAHSLTGICSCFTLIEHAWDKQTKFSKNYHPILQIWASYPSHLSIQSTCRSCLFVIKVVGCGI